MYRHQCLRVISSLTQPASLIRMACWSVAFFVLLIVLLPEIEERVSNDFRRACARSYEPISQVKESSEAVRIAVIGASESIDYLSFEDSIGMSMARIFSADNRPDVTVMEAARAGSTREWKARKIWAATQYDADVIIISLIGPRFFERMKPNEFRFAGRLSFLKIMASPCNALDCIIDGMKPGYKKKLGLLFRGTTPPEDVFGTQIKESPPEQDAAIADNPNMEVVLNNQPNNCFTFDRFDRSTSEQDIIDLLTSMADPALQVGIPVIFVVAPQKSTSLNEACREMDAILERASRRIQNPDLFIFNARSQSQIPDTEFEDIVHLKSFDSVARMFVDFLVEKDLLKRREPLLPEGNR